MDYFKHYSTASESKSMNIIFDEFGHKGIAFYWMLVELCAENWDGCSEPNFSFHQRTVVTKLKSSLNSVRTWLELCSNSGLCAFAQNGTQFEIKMPKLKEIKENRGRIKGNKSEKFDIYRIDKEEEKEIEEMRVADLTRARELLVNSNMISSEAETLLPEKNLPAKEPLNFRNPKDFKFAGIKNPDELIQYWNTDFVLKGYPSSPLTLGGGYQQNFFLINSRLLKEGKTWRDYLARVDRSSFLTVLKKGGKPSITWLLVEKNFDEIMSGKYDDAPEKEDPLDVFMAEFAPKREQA